MTQLCRIVECVQCVQHSNEIFLSNLKRKSHHFLLSTPTLPQRETLSQFCSFDSESFSTRQCTTALFKKNILGFVSEVEI